MMHVDEALQGMGRPWALPGGVAVLGSAAGREAWLEARRSLVGASDVAALMGVSKYGDPYTVWADKTGNAPPEEANDAMRRGQLFEDAIVQLWAERFAPWPVVLRRQGLVRSRQYAHAGATVDRLSVCAMDGKPARCVVEVKSQNDMSEWQGDEVPVAYQLQGLWQLLCTGRDHVHYVALGPRFIPEHRVIRRDEPLMAEMLAKVVAWWTDHVDAGVAPEPTDRSLWMTSRARATGEVYTVAADDEITADLVHVAAAARAEKAAAEKRLNSAVAALQLRMGGATTLAWDDGEVVATWNQGKTVDGANSDWRKAHPDLVAAYSAPGPDVLDVKKLVENHPELIESGSLRYRRTFDWK